MWWFLLKSVAGSIFGSSFYRWFQNTRVGVWFQSSVDNFMQYLADKYDIELAKKEEKWLAQYPALKKRIEELEAQAHYPCGLEEFDDFEKLNQRIKELENGSNTKR